MCPQVSFPENAKKKERKKEKRLPLIEHKITVLRLELFHK